MTQMFFLMGFTHLLLFFQPHLATDLLDVYLKSDSLQNLFMLSQSAVIEKQNQYIIAIMENQNALQHLVSISLFCNAILLCTAGFLFLEKEYHTTFWCTLKNAFIETKNFFTYKRKK